jgi:hypothetical protein
MNAWVNDALRLKADHNRRPRAIDDLLAAEKAEHGLVTEAEIRDAARRARSRAVVVRGTSQEQSRGRRGYGAARCWTPGRSLRWSAVLVTSWHW